MAEAGPLNVVEAVASVLVAYRQQFPCTRMCVQGDRVLRRIEYMYSIMLLLCLLDRQNDTDIPAQGCQRSSDASGCSCDFCVFGVSLLQQIHFFLGSSVCVFCAWRVSSLIDAVRSASRDLQQVLAFGNLSLKVSVMSG